MENKMIEMLNEYKREGCSKCSEDSIFLYVNGKPISFKQAKEKIDSGDRKFIKQIFA